MSLSERIRERLAALAPTELELFDDSSLYAGHAGAAGGGSHFQIRITSAAFIGLGTVQRHRLVYSTLGELMAQEIHALAIHTRAPGEAQSPAVSTTKR